MWSLNGLSKRSLEILVFTSRFSTEQVVAKLGALMRAFKCNARSIVHKGVQLVFVADGKKTTEHRIAARSIGWVLSAALFDQLSVAPWSLGRHGGKAWTGQEEFADLSRSALGELLKGLMMRDRKPHQHAERVHIGRRRRNSIVGKLLRCFPAPPERHFIVGNAAQHTGSESVVHQHRLNAQRLLQLAHSEGTQLAAFVPHRRGGRRRR
mmetsp:Transcript_48198/g.121304  ORF Transcript_48198/g.121304 Transcript_48198/m.121304 type:complete len:209 (+) Transcript_48198:972-1598(+)